MTIAKVFWSGRSQAVRLPKEFRFDADEVNIRRQGSSIVLEPIAKDWEWLEPLIGKIDDDVGGAVKEDAGRQDRPKVDEFFK